jgi:hypothetical protein
VGLELNLSGRALCAYRVSRPSYLPGEGATTDRGFVFSSRRAVCEEILHVRFGGGPPKHKKSFLTLRNPFPWSSHYDVLLPMGPEVRKHLQTGDLLFRLYKRSAESRKWLDDFRVRRLEGGGGQVPEGL